MALKLRGIHRACLWGILLILSITLLAFPTSLTLEYYDMQSTRIFDNLPLFAGLFCIWMAALLILLFSLHNKRENEWEKLALVCVFSAVFIGFWTILTFSLGRGEGIFNDAHVRYLNQFGKIPIGNRVLSYFDFPGLHLIGSFVSQVIGLDPIRSASAILFVQTVFFAALLYVLFRRFISNASVASLAVLIVIQGNIWISKLNIFHPRNLGLFLLVTFIVIISRQGKGLFRTIPDIIIILIVTATTTVTHFVTSYLIFFIMVGIYIIKIRSKDNSESVSTLVIFIVLPLSWALYWAILMFGGTIQYVFSALQTWVSKGDTLWTILMSLQANIGGIMSIWSNISRLYWWILIYGIGSLLWLRNLFRNKQLPYIEKIVTGIMFGIVVVSILSIIGSNGGERFDTYLLYGALTATPILLGFLLRLKVA